MSREHLLGIFAGGFVVINVIVMLWSLSRGRNLCRRLAERYPREYAALGSPMPSIFDAVRGADYYRFLLQERFSSLTDPGLREAFARLRRFERRHLTIALTGLAILGLAMLAVR